MFDLLDGVQAETEEDAKAEIAGRFLRAEHTFFRDHWQRAHPTQAGEITRHIVEVTRLVRVMDCHKWVLESRFEGLTE